MDSAGSISKYDHADNSLWNQEILGLQPRRGHPGHSSGEENTQLPVHDIKFQFGFGARVQVVAQSVTCSPGLPVSPMAPWGPGSPWNPGGPAGPPSPLSPEGPWPGAKRTRYRRGDSREGLGVGERAGPLYSQQVQGLPERRRRRPFRGHPG